MQSTNGSTSITIIMIKPKSNKSNKSNGSANGIYRRLDQLDMIEVRKGSLSGKQEREYAKLTRQLENED